MFLASEPAGGNLADTSGLTLFTLAVPAGFSWGVLTAAAMAGTTGEDAFVCFPLALATSSLALIIGVTVVAGTEATLLMTAAGTIGAAAEVTA